MLRVVPPAALREALAMAALASADQGGVLLNLGPKVRLPSIFFKLARKSFKSYLALGLLAPSCKP